MDEKKSEYFKDIGYVIYLRHKRARSIKVHVRPFKPVKIVYPYYVSQKQARLFFLDKQLWVKNNLKKMQAYEQAHTQAQKNMKPLDIIQAKKAILARVSELATIHGFVVPKVMIRKQKTLWGSCSANNTISLNIHLAQLPLELMDYVIMHEFVHFDVKDHSRRFWTALRRYISYPEFRDRQLKKYALGIG